MIEESDRKATLEFQRGIEVLLRPGVVVQSEVDRAQIRISSGSEVRIGRQAQGHFVARFGLRQVTVLLRIDPEIQLAGGVRGLKDGGSSEVSNGLVDSPLPDQRVGEVIFGYVIVIG